MSPSSYLHEDLITVSDIGVGDFNLIIDLFYRYGGHIEFIRFKEYYGMLKGHEYDPIYSLSIYTRAFRAHFSSIFSRKRL